MTGIEVAKVGYLVLKYGAFPLFYVLYGFDFKHYEIFFDHHFDSVLMITVGTSIAVVDSIEHAYNSVSLNSDGVTIFSALVVVALKSVIGVSVSAVATWVIQLFKPFINRKTSEIKKWIQNRIK